MQVYLTFYINHVSEVNDKLNQMVATLTQQLVEQKLSYELNLRDSFQRVLQSDFLPLLRINRYELTKLSLYGFDIYVLLPAHRWSPCRQFCRYFPGWM